MCEVRNNSCFRKHKYARTSHGMASESLSRRVDLIFAQDFCFIRQEHGPPRVSHQAQTDVLLTTVLGLLRRQPSHAAPRATGSAPSRTGTPPRLSASVAAAATACSASAAAAAAHGSGGAEAAWPPDGYSFYARSPAARMW